MKRDMDLMRNILLRIEEQSTPAENTSVNLDFAGYSQAVIMRHAVLLHQAGYIKGDNWSPVNGDPEFNARALTNAGYDFLDDARNETVWHNVKAALKEKGGDASFDVLKALLGAAALRYFGLSG